MLIGDYVLPCLAFHIHGCFWLAMEESKTDSHIAFCWMEYLLTKHSLDNSGFLNTSCYTHKLNVNCSVELVYHYNEEYLGKCYMSFKLYCCGMYRDLLKNLKHKKAH